MHRCTVSRMRPSRHGREAGAAARLPCKLQASGRRLERKHSFRQQHLHESRFADPLSAGLDSTDPPPDLPCSNFSSRIGRRKRFRHQYLQEYKRAKPVSVGLHSTNLPFLEAICNLIYSGCIISIFRTKLKSRTGLKSVRDFNFVRKLIPLYLHFKG